MSLLDKLSRMRRDYDRDTLEEEQIAADPLEQFHRWLADAVRLEVAEPNAMTLATVGANGRPSCRPVLLKGADARGLVWYTNYESRKGRELANNPYAALQFHWVELERVVRIEGRVERLPPQESDAYFAERPLANRIGAWASPQSEPIPNRAFLLERAAYFAAQYGLDPPRPPHWGGYLLIPDYWEFWQGRPSRLHDRIAYLPDAHGGWRRQRLAP